MGDHKEAIVESKQHAESPVQDDYSDALSTDQGSFSDDTSEDEYDQRFKKLEGRRVGKNGEVVDSKGNVLGKVSNGNRKKAVGRKIQEHGVIYDSKGAFVASVVPIDPPKQEKEESSTEEESDEPIVERSGNVVDKNGDIVAKLVKGERAKAVGCTVDMDGNVKDKNNRVVGKAEFISQDEGMFVESNGQVMDETGNIVGKLIKGNRRKLAGMPVDEDGNVLDHQGNIVGTVEFLPFEASEEDKKAQAEEKEQRKIAEQLSVAINQTLSKANPLLKMINKQIESFDRKDPKERDEDALVTGVKPLLEEAASILAQADGAMQSLDPVGNVRKSAEYKVHEREASEEEHRCVELLKQLKDANETVDNVRDKIADMPHPKEEDPEDVKSREIAQQMCTFIEQAIHRIKPILSMITESIQTEESKPEKERDEDELVKKVRPLLEEGSGILNEANGAIRGLDPSGKIAKTAQAKSAEKKASPEEYHLADLLSQLTGEVSKTIENAKKKIASMPKAEKELSPLWGLLQNPLLQILSAVGLLLAGVLGLLGNILNGLGLGGLVNNLLGGLGLNKILEGLGVHKLLGSKKK